jgi:hypothetical protein
MPSKANGNAGEAAVAAVLGYSGWEIVQRQYLTHGHRLDFLVRSPARGEALVEVKVWATKSGRDTVKKAIADAYDLRLAGEVRPVILILSEHMSGLHDAMLRRCIAFGAIAEVLILSFEGGRYA